MSLLCHLINKRINPVSQVFPYSISNEKTIVISIDFLPKNLFSGTKSDERNDNLLFVVSEKNSHYLSRRYKYWCVDDLSALAEMISNCIFSFEPNRIIIFTDKPSKHKYEFISHNNLSYVDSNGCLICS